MPFGTKRILVAVDFRECAAAALRLALRFAARYSAEVSIVHAIEPAQKQSPLARHVSLPEPDARLSRVENDLVVFIRAAIGRKPMLRYRILEGHPTEAILFAAGYEKVDLIVLGTRGIGGADRLTLGSVAEQVLRRSDIPVLTICPRRATRRRPADIRRILCAVNYTAVAKRSFEAAVSIARHFDAEVVALHVIETKRRESDLGEEKERLRLWMRDRLPKAKKPEPLVVSGNAAAEVLRYAGANEIDLIVVGARRERSSDVPVFGSTTERVTRNAPCAVLTITETPDR